MTDPIRVLLVDDHRLVRAGLQSLLEGDDTIEVVGTAEDGEQAVRLVADRHPHVVLMDLSMPVMDGVEATRRIVSSHDDVYVVVLTSFGDTARITDAIDAGAVGYLLKDAAPDDLLSGVYAAARGESPLDPRAARALLRSRPPEPRHVDLTDREREVLVLLGRALPNKEIAQRLGITERTVKAHLTSIYQRIGVTDRTSAALWARAHGVEQTS